MAEQKAVGTAVPRAEGGAKVSGETLYAADVKLPGLLWAKFLRSPHAHAYIRNVDTAKAAKVPGVRAIITGADVKGFLIGKQIRDMPVLCWDKVRFSGDRGAGLGAESAEVGEGGVHWIGAKREPLPAVFDPIE